MAAVSIHHRAGPKRWSRGLLAAAGLLLAACGGGATLVETTPGGGVVTYPFNSGLGHLASPFRADALTLIRERCGGLFTIVREGEARSRVREVQTVAGRDVIEERRWGLEFRCGGAGGAPTSEPRARSAPAR